jgi:hypothetical protein
MNINVIVTAQYYENYNVGPDGFGETPYWKPKGGHTFNLPLDSDTLFYGEDVLIAGIKELLKKQNSIAQKFEYIEHDILWDEPTVLDGLEDEMIKMYKELEEINF